MILISKEMIFSDGIRFPLLKALEIRALFTLGNSVRKLIIMAKR